MRDQARFQEEMDKRKSMEDDLRKQAELAQQDAIPEGDLAQQLDRLQKIEQRQRQEINRYTHTHIHNSTHILSVDAHKTFLSLLCSHVGNEREREMCLESSFQSV